MAPSVPINLNEVVEKPRLPAAQQFTFSFRKAEQAMGKKPNKQTQKIEPYLACEAYPIDPGWEDRCVYQNFSMAPGALASPDPTFSVKKFFQVVGFAWGPSENSRPGFEAQFRQPHWSCGILLMARRVLPALNLDVYAERRCLSEAWSSYMFVKSTINKRFQTRGDMKNE